MAYDPVKARWARIFKVYGITQEEYYEYDSGRCPICLRPWSPTVRPAVDHDHVSNYVRGVLCTYCNHRIVGRHRDHELIYRLARYLDEQPRRHLVPKKPPKKRRRKKSK